MQSERLHLRMFREERQDEFLGSRYIDGLCVREPTGREDESTREGAQAQERAHHERHLSQHGEQYSSQVMQYRAAERRRREKFIEKYRGDHPSSVWIREC